MKHILFFLLVVPFLLITPSSTHAQGARSEVIIDLDAGPGQTAPAEFSRVKLRTRYRCDQGNITIGYDRIGDNKHSFDRECASYSGEYAEIQPDRGFGPGGHKILYKCGCGWPVLIPNPDKIFPAGTDTTPFFTSEAQTTPPTFRVEPSNPSQTDRNTKIIVEGCPADSPIGVHFELTVAGGGWFGGTGTTSFDMPPRRTNGEGRLEYSQTNSGFPAGDYNVTVHCGGADFSGYSFTVSRQEITPTDYPAPPETPNCSSADPDTGQCLQVITAIGEFDTREAGFIMTMFRVFLSLSGGIAVLIIIYAGYLIMTSRGNAEQLQKGRDMLTSALIGLFFIIFSFVILEVLTIDILQIPGFRRSN